MTQPLFDSWMPLPIVDVQARPSYVLQLSDICVLDRHYTPSVDKQRHLLTVKA
jgi:hypothetical protein